MTKLSAVALPRRPPPGRGRPFGRTVALLCSVTLIACGGGSGDGGVDGGPGDDGALAGSCGLEPMREWVEDSMLDYYLFADRVRPVPLASLASDEAVLEALRVSPEDRFSYVTDEATYDARFESGRTFGFGWRLERVDPDTWIISRVAPGSPFAEAGIVRGDRLVAIGGIDLADFVELAPAERTRRLGPPATPTRVSFTIESATAGRTERTIESAEYPLITVADVQVSERDGTRVGYLDFTSFVETSRGELAQAYDALAGVDELVLDLRHNGGGRVDVSAELAAALGGPVLEDEVFARFEFNARYAARNIAMRFATQPATLDLPRVFVLTSERTCSASELLINGLEPFIDVVTLGQDTCGKPYATTPERRCGRVLNALEITSRNAVGVGDYTEGLRADCLVEDDPRRAQGRPGDPLYDAALAFLDTGSCALAASVPAPAERRRGAATWPGDDPLETGAILP